MMEGAAKDEHLFSTDASRLNELEVANKPPLMTSVVGFEKHA